MRKYSCYYTHKTHVSSSLAKVFNEMASAASIWTQKMPLRLPCEENFCIITIVGGVAMRITGVVAAGKHVGRTLGFPTANILPDEGCVLPEQNGVYAALLTLSDGRTLPLSLIHIYKTRSAEDFPAWCFPGKAQNGAPSRAGWKAGSPTDSSRSPRPRAEGCRCVRHLL